MIKLLLILLCILTMVHTVLSQEQIGDISDENMERVGPHIPNTPLPKGFLASYRLFSPFPISSKAVKNNYPSPGEGKVLRLEENEYKIKIPLLLRDYTTFLLGAKYRYEEYHFKQPEEYPLYRELNNKHLNYLSLDFYLDHKLIKRRFFSLKAGVQLIGDYNKNNIIIDRFLKYSIALAFGWKKTDDYSIGFGIYSNYIYGSPSIYPVFIFNRAYGDHLALQMALPASIKLHYRVDDKSIFTSALEFDGASYNIAVEHPPFNGYTAVELTRSDLLASITYEREIYDFIWFTLTGGYRYNVGFNLNDGNKFNSRKLMENKINGSPYVSGGIFITLPRKYRGKYLHKNTEEENDEH